MRGRIKLLLVLGCGLLAMACSDSDAVRSPDNPAGKAADSEKPVVVADASPDYLRARWNPIHMQPAIATAKDEQCLECHQEILSRNIREASPAGVKKDEVLAWYQTVDTYNGDQETFHRRHLVTPFAKQVMDLKCNTCHQGNDPREESSGSSATDSGPLTLRKSVDPDTCLMCHGKFNYQIMGIPGEWPQNGAIFNNSCLTCHVAIRTQRHQVNFLKPEAIEKAGTESADACYGCHGGRAWYRINYPYPRHPWAGSGDAVPEWAKDRPVQSQGRFLVGVQQKSGM